MLRFLFLSLLASTSAFHTMSGMTGPGSYHIQLVEYGELPRQRHSLCLPTPFLRQICLPTALQFFMPQRTLGPGDQRCFTLPTMTTYVVRVCPRRQPQIEMEPQPEERKNEVVVGGEAPPEEAVKGEGVGGKEESEVRDESERRDLVEGSGKDGPSEREDLEEENDSIMSNYV